MLWSYPLHLAQPGFVPLVRVELHRLRESSQEPFAQSASRFLKIAKFVLLLEFLNEREHRVVSLARTLDLAEHPPAPCLWMLDRNRERAEQLIPDGSPILGVAPTANWRGKIWRGERFVDLIERLTGSDRRTDAVLPNARVAVFGGPGETAAAATVINSIPRLAR